MSKIWNPGFPEGRDIAPIPDRAGRARRAEKVLDVVTVRRKIIADTLELAGHVEYRINGQNRHGVSGGRNVASDRVRAHMWFNLAAAISIEGNAKLAAENRDSITKRLTREQLFHAQEMAHQCEASSFKNCD